MTDLQGFRFQYLHLRFELRVSIDASAASKTVAERIEPWIPEQT